VGSLIGRIVDRALAHDAEQRFESAAELAIALRIELGRANVSEPLSELALFLEEPETYKNNFTARIVPLVLEAGKAARRNGQVPLATALYNRALSLRPGDPDIIADVARLTRLRRLRNRVLPLGLVAMVIGVVSVVAVRGYQRVKSVNIAKTTAKRLIPNGSASTRRVPELVNRPASSLEPTETPSIDNGMEGHHVSSVSEAKSATVVSRGNGKTIPKTTTVKGTRLVQVELRGAKGSRLLLDGVEKSWFGTKHELDYGLHRLVVIAPNDNCCIVPEPKVIKVEPGEGELDIVMQVEFREALLQFGAVTGSTLTCGELFPGVLESPGRRAIRMTQAETRASCTLIPPPESGKHPRTIDVVLRPGGTFTVNGT
jgi:hypothetical protein